MTKHVIFLTVLNPIMSNRSLMFIDSRLRALRLIERLELAADAHGQRAHLQVLERMSAVIGIFLSAWAGYASWQSPRDLDRNPRHPLGRGNIWHHTAHARKKLGKFGRSYHILYTNVVQELGQAWATKSCQNAGNAREVRH